MFKIAIVTFVAGAFSMGCGSKDAPSGAAAVEVSADMKAFIGGMGSSAKVEAALKKHGVAGLDAKSMEMYDLKDPKVIAKKGDCYDFEAKAGMTTRTYAVCWAGGKIKTVESKGMK